MIFSNNIFQGIPDGTQAQEQEEQPEEGGDEAPASGGLLNKTLLEQFSIECRKTKTKVIISANQNKDKYHNEPMRTQSKYK